MLLFFIDIDAINKFRMRIHCPFVINCQLDRYQILKGNGHILDIDQKDVVVQKPKPSQALDYLNQAGAKELSCFFKQEPSQLLRDVADTPEMLAILAQTYKERAGKCVLIVPSFFFGYTAREQ